MATSCSIMNLIVPQHWHGFFQKSTNYADGAAWVTQCPITKATSFEYSFQALNQAGTFWYHSHVGGFELFSELLIF
jgi:iron transport multicopper oxidase